MGADTRRQEEWRQCVAEAYVTFYQATGWGKDIVLPLPCWEATATPAHAHTHTREQVQPSLSGSPWLCGLHAELPWLSAEARIILDSIIKCHVITRYGVVLPLPPSPLGWWSLSDRYGEMCVCAGYCFSPCVCDENGFDEGRRRHRKRVQFWLWK